MRIFYLSILIIIFGFCGYSVASDLPVAVDTPAEQNQTVEDIPDADISVNPPISYDMPDYPKGGARIIGEIKEYIIGEEDTLMDIARYYNLGFVSVLGANNTQNEFLDPWTPIPGKKIYLPLQHLIPRALQKGIIVNLGEMRLFYFDEKGGVVTYPIGIGREGLQTPLGETTIIKKLKNPSWYPTKRMRDANPDLPVRVPPSASNPLGKHALYFGWPEYRIHGTSKPWGIGRRVSSGCIRMYPESIKELFPNIAVNTKVQVIDQPVKLAWVGDKLYMEAHPSREQSDAIEKYNFIPEELIDNEIPEDLLNFIKKTAGDYSKDINWKKAKQIFVERKGYPFVLHQVKIKAKKSEKEKETNESKSQ